MKKFKMKAWLMKEKKMVSIIGIDFNYEYIRYTEDDNLFNENYKTAEFKNIELLQFTGLKDNGAFSQIEFAQSLTCAVITCLV